MTPLGRQIVRGMAITTAGAFIWALVFSLIAVLRGTASWSEVAWFPPIGLFYASWLVLPLGVVLGIFLPRFVRQYGLSVAVATSCFVGAGVGALVAYLVARFIWQVAFQKYAVTMIPFCAVWVAAWACWLHRRQTHERSA